MFSSISGFDVDDDLLPGRFPRVQVPPEVVARIVEIAVLDSHTFLNLLLLNKSTRRYLESHLDCASHILFSVAGPDCSSPAKSRRGWGWGRKQKLPLPLHSFSLSKPFVRRIRICRDDVSSSEEYASFFQLFPHLRELEIRNAKELDQGALRSICGGQPELLEKLQFVQCGIRDEFFSEVEFGGLRSLYVRACGEENCVTSSLLSRMPRLEKLEVEAIFVTFEWSADNFAACASSLRKIVLTHVCVGRTLMGVNGGHDRQGDVDGEFSIFTKLEVLLLSHVRRVSEMAFRGIAPSLRKLHLLFCQLSRRYLGEAIGYKRLIEIEDFVIRDRDPGINAIGGMRPPNRHELRELRQRMKLREKEAQEYTKSIEGKFQLRFEIGYRRRD